MPKSVAGTLQGTPPLQHSVFKLKLLLTSIICFIIFLAECGIVAQVLEPIAEANISLYYISTFYSDHTLVSLLDCLYMIDKNLINS